MLQVLRSLFASRASSASSTGRRGDRRRVWLEVESLEARLGLDGAGSGTRPRPGGFQRSPDIAPPPAGAFTPSMIQSAYGFDKIGFLQGNYNALAGQGQTIAIIDGGYSGGVQADLGLFDHYLG